METFEFKVTLPDELAREAGALGLLKADELERMIREEIRRHRIGQFFDAADRLAVLAERPLTASEVEAEIHAARAERRAAHARGA